jgi:hypothetical protein
MKTGNGTGSHGDEAVAPESVYGLAEVVFSRAGQR